MENVIPERSTRTWPSKALWVMTPEACWVNRHWGMMGQDALCRYWGEQGSVCVFRQLGFEVWKMEQWSLSDAPVNLSDPPCNDPDVASGLVPAWRAYFQRERPPNSLWISTLASFVLTLTPSGAETGKKRFILRWKQKPKIKAPPHHTHTHSPPSWNVQSITADCQAAFILIKAWKFFNL